MRNKVTVVGAGNVGASCAVRLAQLELADVVVVDVLEGVPTGKALDILQSTPVAGVNVSTAGVNGYEALRAATSLSSPRASPASRA